MNYDILRNFQKDSFVSSQKKQILERFEQCANELYPNLLTLFPEIAANYLFEIESHVSDACNQAFLKQCILVAIPTEFSTGLNEAKIRLNEQMKQLCGEEIVIFGFADLCSQLQSISESIVTTALSLVNISVLQTKEFHENLKILKSKITSLVDSSEKSKRIEYMNWKKELDDIKDEKQRKEIEKIQSESHQKLQQELSRLQEKCSQEQINLKKRNGKNISRGNDIFEK